MINRWIIVGRLGQAPEMRYTASGKAVTNLSVATDIGFGDNKRTEWVRVTAWDKSAEACAQYLGKGSLVYVEGRAETRKWDDKDGVTRYSTELQAERVQFLDSKGERQPVAAGEADIDPDDLPFHHSPRIDRGGDL